MSPSIRDQIHTHPPGFLAEACEVEPVSAGLAESPHEAAYALRCRCGAGGFRVLGVPVAMAGGARGFVLRSVLRVWRELRASASGDAGEVTRLSPPIAIDCARCGAIARLVPAEEDDAIPGARPAPLEALRCRPCRHSTFAVVARFEHPDAELDAEARGGEEEHFDAWHLGVRCLSCGMTLEPFALGRRSEQQRRIDRLYGRDPSEAHRS